MSEVNEVLQNIESSKAQLNAIDDLVNKENAQIQKDERKDQNDTKSEETMIHDLNENIRRIKQQLQQIVSKTHSMDFRGMHCNS